MPEPEYRVEPLSPHHDRAAFSCGVDQLDRYLREQASQDQRRRVAAVYILSSEGSDIVAGYYTLSSCSIEPSELAPHVAKRLPRYPALPGTLIGRLAVDQRYQGQGLGTRLLGEALERAYSLSAQVGSVAIVVDAKDEPAARFYERHAFRRFAIQPLRLYLTMATLEAGLRRN